MTGIVLFSFGKQIKVYKQDKSIIHAEKLGKLNLIHQKILVGDFVEIIIKNNLYFISNVFERKNQLIKPKIVNVDWVYLIVSLKDPDFNLNYMLQQLLFFQLQNTKVKIVFSKTDLINLKKFKQDNQLLIENFDCYFINKNTDFDIKKFLGEENNKIIIFTGNSGVGKSSLLNKICPELKLNTQEVSIKLKKGKQTTTATTLYPFMNNFLADTPGFSEISFEYFSRKEIHFFKLKKNIDKCRFDNCLHLSEPDCEVKKFIEKNPNYDIFYEIYKIILSKK